jgi:hypothetical protein
VDFPAELDVQAFLAPYKEKHGDVIAVMTVSGPMVFRGADMKEMAIFEDTAKKAGRLVACKQLCILTVVSTDKMAMGGDRQKARHRNDLRRRDLGVVRSRRERSGGKITGDPNRASLGFLDLFSGKDTELAFASGHLLAETLIRVREALKAKG